MSWKNDSKCAMIRIALTQTQLNTCEGILLKYMSECELCWSRGVEAAEGNNRK